MVKKSKKPVVAALDKLQAAFSERFRAILAEKKMHTDDVVRASKVLKHAAVYRWQTARRFPEPPSMRYLEQALGMSAEDILGKIDPGDQWWKEMHALREIPGGAPVSESGTR